VIISGLRELNTIPSPAALVGWLLLTCAGLLIGWATSVGLASLAFWAPRLSLGVLHSAAWEFGRYPIDIYRRWVRQLLTFAFPVAVITTWPARTLVRGPELGILFTGVVLAIGFTAGTLLLWRSGLRRYTGATS
jgi:ABC-2 type transport system permease protein